MNAAIINRIGRVSALALVTSAACMATGAYAQAADEGLSSSDIIVTATKRSENIRDVAMPISAVTGEQLAAANANSLGDYIVRLPGVVFNDYQPGVSEVVIRGIAATTYHEQGQTTVGYYINEIPVVEPGFPIGIPDVDTFDLERVEVLRGPQGTLFGSSTLGGLVNYVVKTADPTQFEAAASGSVGTTKNAGSANYSGKAMVNVPIIANTLAVRLMALQRFDAGYIDNLGTATEGSNDFRTRGLRGSLVFTPSEATTLTYLSAWQDSKLDDQTYITSPTALTRVTQNNEPQKTRFFLNSLRLDQDVGFADLSILGSVNKKTNTTVFDSSFYGFLTGNTVGPLAPISIGNATANIKHGEIRLSSKGEGPVRWLIGASYMRAKKYSYDQVIAPGAETALGAAQAPGDRIYGYISDTLNEDLGIFGEVAIKPAAGVELTLGGRYYDNRAVASVTNQRGYVSGSAVDLTGNVDQSESGFTPKATLALRPSDNFMAYVTYSKGYRIGGINPNAGLLPTIPTSYDSDTVDNYEAGVKFEAFDDKLVVDATVFNIDWKKIQARLFGPFPNYYSYVTNAGSANIAGVELAAAYAFSRVVSFSTSATLQNARLTSFLPDTFAAGGGYASGSTLPGSSKWTVANNLKFDLVDTAGAPTLELAHRYISAAPVAFGNPTTRGNFSQFDIRASYGITDTMRVLGFVSNIFDKRGILSGPFSSQTAPAYSVIRPRTMGIRVDLSM